MKTTFSNPSFVTILCLLAAAVNLPAKAETIPPDFKKAVTFIFPADLQGQLLRDKDGRPVPWGTGFFVQVKSEDQKSVYGYLVTAKHVLRDEHGKDYERVFVRLNKKDGDAEYERLDLVQNGRRVAFTHPDQSVDLAVVPVLPDQSVFDFKTIPEDMLTTQETFNEFNIGEGTDIFFVGLFTTYFGEHKNNPIIRFGHVAMLPDDPIDWIDYEGQPRQRAKLYLVETGSYGGNSGSPVFFWLGADRSPKQGYLLGSWVIKFAGVMRGKFNDIGPTVISVQTPTAANLVTLPNVGIAAVTPSYFVHEVLFSDELKKFRADHPVQVPASEK